MTRLADSHHETYRTGDERPISRAVIEHAIHVAGRREQWKTFGRHIWTGLCILVLTIMTIVIVMAVAVVIAMLALTVAHDFARLEGIDRW
jgi:hypothetical protein